MQILVTGGAGFIGANLCSALASRGHQVRALDDLSTGHQSNLSGLPDVRLTVGSLLQRDVIEQCVIDADAVVHLGARPSVPRSIADPVASHEVNVNGTINLLEVCRAMPKAPQIIFASSSSVYGSNPIIPKHEGLATLPRSPYAASKLAGEGYMLAYASSFGFDVLPFRFFNVYGPLQAAGHAYAAVVPAFVEAALHGRPLPVHGDGSQTRDFTHVETVAECIAIAIENRISSAAAVNLAFGTRTSLRTVIELLSGIVGHPLEIDYLPTRPGDVRDSQAENSVLRGLFPTVTPIDLAVGLQTCVDWMRTL
jgi:UDP-glucose 4-epimerase